MNRNLTIAAFGLLGAGLFAMAAKIPSNSDAARTAGDGNSPSTRPADGWLVVHEWGTFTGFAGSDGIHLPFHTNIGEGLPQFVSNRKSQEYKIDATAEKNPEFLFRKWDGAAALQRMETPIVYFYADRATSVEARVDFPGGTLTEFYPPVRSMGPAYGRAPGEPRPTPTPAARPSAGATPAGPAEAVAESLNARVEPSFLDWGTLRIVPKPTGIDGSRVPAVKDGNHYGLARATDAALVQFTNADGKLHEENFLFYRGLGNFALPVTLRATGNDRFELNNAGSTPVRAAFLFRSDGSGKTPTHFTQVENVSGRRELVLPSAQAAKGDLPSAILRSLLAEGLYEKEARAMLETWKAGWLGEPGVRVLYLVPRPVTDALLPLQIKPAPAETVRVLVGRIDVMTPELEARMTSMLSTQVGGPAAEDMNALHGIHRFLQPAIDRAARLRGKAATMEESGRITNAYYKWLSTTKPPSTEPSAVLPAD